MAVKEYRYEDNTQLSPHFNVREFSCKCGRKHCVFVDTDLVDKLEKLREKLNCSKIIINSGHRCESHDRSVGGTGRGKHVDGMAVDIVCYDKNNKIISSKLVSCISQDIGFGGIANIDRTYTTTHVDTRTTNLWKGDEVRGKSYSVTNDFYFYYGIPKQVSDNQQTSNSGDKITVSYRCYSNKKWLSEITNYNTTDDMGYSGMRNHPMHGVVIKVDKGTIKYRVHKKGGNWCNWISAYNTNDWMNGVAGGQNMEIDGIQIDYIGNKGYKARYRVATVGSNTFYPWVTGADNYAGVYGQSISRLQIEIVKAE